MPMFDRSQLESRLLGPNFKRVDSENNKEEFANREFLQGKVFIAVPYSIEELKKVYPDAFRGRKFIPPLCQEEYIHYWGWKDEAIECASVDEKLVKDDLEKMMPQKNGGLEVFTSIQAIQNYLDSIQNRYPKLRKININVQTSFESGGMFGKHKEERADIGKAIEINFPEGFNFDNFIPGLNYIYHVDTDNQFGILTINCTYIPGFNNYIALGTSKVKSEVIELKKAFNKDLKQRARRKKKMDNNALHQEMFFADSYEKMREIAKKHRLKIEPSDEALYIANSVREISPNTRTKKFISLPVAEIIPVEDF